MKSIESDIMYDFESIPALPASIYFYDSHGEIHPKKIFTVSKKRINHNEGKVEIYINEFNKFIDFTSDEAIMRFPPNFNPN